MARSAAFEWQGKEYEFKDKNADWYWALGILGTAAAVASILFGNVLLAVVIAAGAASVALMAAKRPKIHRFALTEQGLIVDRDLFPYDVMLSFSILEYVDEIVPPSLSIKTESMLMPHIIVPLQDVDVIAVYEYLLPRVSESAHDHSLSDHLIELFRI